MFWGGATILAVLVEGEGVTRPISFAKNTKG